MKIQMSLLPHKHVRFANSLVGTAGYVRQFISDAPISIDGLWAKIQADNNKLFKIDFTHLIYSLDVLIIIKEIKVDSSSLIHKIEKRYETD